MLDVIWPALIAAALICGALAGRLDAVAAATTESARSAVDLAIGLLGTMTLWLGLVRVLESGGFMHVVARALRPLLRWLFPDVPPDHPAMGFMVLNISSNVLGLSNAATPFGIKAMLELERLNPSPGTATDAMALFLAINTANVALFPTEIIALRASLGSTAPGSIVLPTFVATLISTAVAIVSAKLLAPLLPVRGSAARPPQEVALAEEMPDEPVRTPAGRIRRILAVAMAAAVIGSLLVGLWARAHDPAGWGGALRVLGNSWMLPLLVAGVVVWGLARGVPVYARAVEGGREAFTVTLSILPYLVMILVATGMLRASGGFELLLRAAAPLAAVVHIPPEAVPMGLLRSLSGSGARGLAAELMKMHGPDSFVGNVVSVIQGSTETTFYVIAVYFGAVRVRAGRHTLAACLLSDAVGVLASVWACRWFLG